MAVYYAPEVSDPLWRAGCAWLGRDAESGGRGAQPDVPGIAEWTAEPAAYGFHATLKPPMRLRTSYGAFRDDVAAVAGRIAPFELPALAVMDVGGFVALREVAPCPALHALSDRCVEGLDEHRAEAGEAELARRRAGDRLSEAQEAMLVRWGYPYVLATWFFHITLTRRLPEGERGVAIAAANGHFAGKLGPRPVDAVTIFTQAGAGAPFLAAERVALGLRGR